MLNFDTNNKKAGFRLKYLQVYNWGLYNNEVFTISPEMQSSLLIGGNASGKTTLIDALLTLFLSNPKYNLAGDAQKKNDRDISSYILGNYSEVTNEKGEIVPERLRKNDDYSIILASFYNNGLKQDITLGQFFWFKTSDSKRPERLYFLSFNKALTIESDLYLYGITGISDFKKRLEINKIYSLNKNQVDRKGIYTDNYTTYSDRFAELFGLRNKNKALNLFNQTVSLKNIGDLNNFIRNEMLENENIEPSIGKIKQAFDEAKMFSDEIEKTERKIELIEPIKTKGNIYTRLKDELENTQNSIDILNSFFGSLKQTLLRKEKQEKEQEKEKQQKDFIEKFHEETGWLKQKKNKQDEVNKSITAIENNTGISQTIANIQLKKANLTPIKNKYNEYEKLSKKINISLPEDENIFLNNKTDIERQQYANEEEKEKISLQKDNFLKQIIAPIEIQIEKISGEITNLSQNKGLLIEKKYQVARQRICEHLNIEKSELPFICELIKVRDTESNWRNLIEMLFREFGLSLIINDSYYNQAIDFINSSEFVNTKIQFYRFHENQHPEAINIDSQHFLSRLEIKQECNPMFKKWIENQIATYYNYIYCDTIEGLHKASMAITNRGLIKQDEFFYEKEDINNINKSDYILGWDNSEKLTALENELHQLNESLEKEKKIEKSFQERINDIIDSQKVIEKLLEINSFEEIDFKTIENDITGLENTLKSLKENKELEKLKKESADFKKKIEDLETEKTTLIGDISKLEANINSDIDALKDCENDIKTASEQDQEAFYSLIYPLILEEIKHSKQISETKNKIHEDLKLKKENITNPCDKLRKEIVDTMLRFGVEFSDEMKQNELRNEIEFLDDFIAIYEKLKEDRLEDLKEDFDLKLRSRSDKVITDFWNKLDSLKKNIENKTGRNGRINELLKKREYQENKTFLQIIPNETKDEEISNFKKEIKSCFYPIGGLLTAEDRLKRNKEIFVNIKNLLEKLEKYNLPGDRWAKKVTDVRNWFSFTASERDIHQFDKEVKAHSGTASKSGGETFKITYTILASAIADEFGLVGNQVQTSSLRFIAVDEIFNNLGVQWSKYVLKMFEDMDLQLLIVSPDSLEKANIAKEHIKNVHWTYKQIVVDEKNKETDNSFVIDITFDKLTQKVHD